MRILALSLDLDDTLWPVTPAILSAERALHDWLQQHHTAVATRWPVQAMRELREAISAERPDLAHDFTAQRLLTLQRAFATCGFGDEHIDAAFEVYFDARNRVECYSEVEAALTTLAARLPLISLSNGNADLERIGLRRHFVHCISAREFGVGKPDPAIFLNACARLGLAPENVLHVGDDALLDVAGAHAAGLRTGWLNRHAQAWTETAFQPDLQLRDLDELVRWLDRRAA